MSYDSTEDTVKHIRKVRETLLKISRKLLKRAEDHDKTKLEEPEKPIYDEYTPKLEDSEYGSEEYNEFLEGMKEGLDHHYSEYRHHPEHFENGVHDMHLLDLLEMVADWEAAVSRHDDGRDIYDSIDHNADRFEYGEELKQILENTADFLKELKQDSQEEG